MLPQHHQQNPPLSLPPSQLQDGYSVSSHSSSSSAQVATMPSSRQEYVYKEMESTLNLFDSRQGHPRSDSQPDFRPSKPWRGSMLLENIIPPENQPADTREPTYYEIRSTRFQSQLSQDNSSSRPSKRRREEHYSPPPPPSSSSLINTPSQDNNSGRSKRRREEEHYGPPPQPPSSSLINTPSQGNNSGRSKRRREEEHNGPPPPPPSSSFINTPPSERLAPTVPIRIPPLKSSTNSSSTAPSSSSSNFNNDEPPPALLLLSADLWSQFHEQHNEMIITKSGRCLFPCLRFRILGLDPNSYYSLRLDFEMVTPNRFRFYNGAWKAVEPLRQVDDSYSPGSQDSHDSTDHPTAATSGHLRESYIHPDRFQLGSHWMTNPISFNKVKLTNKVESPSNVAKRAASNQRTDPTASAINNNSNHHVGGGPSSELSGVNDINTNVFHISSFHKYCPRIYLTQRAKGSPEITNSIVYRFDRTEFMAVTHYQNYKVNDLKKSYNPHAKGFRGTIGKVLPPVKFPAAAEKHDRGVLNKHPSLASLVRPKKRTRSSSRLDESDSDCGMDGDNDPDNEEADMIKSVAMDSVNAEMSRTRSGMQYAAVGASVTRVLEKNISPTCRLDKDNDTLVTISLDKGGKDDAKISERTTQHYFGRNAPLNGDVAVDIPKFHSRSTTSETSWIGHRFIPRTQSTSGDSPARSRHFNGISHHRHQPQQPSLLFSHKSNNKIGVQQRSPPLQPLFFNRASTVRMGRAPTHHSDIISNTLSTASHSPHMSSMLNGSVVDGNNDGADLLHLNQSIPSISLEPLENDLMSDQYSSQVPLTELECSDLVAEQASTTMALNTAPAPPPQSWYREFLWDHNTTHLSQDPAPTAGSAASTVVPDDVNGSRIPLTFQQLTAMNSAAAAASSSSAVGLVPSSTLSRHEVPSVQWGTVPYGCEDGCGNGVVPTMTVFGSGTSTPSVAIVGSSHHSYPAPITSGRLGAESSMSGGLYSYGPGGSAHPSGNSSGRVNEFNPDPQMLKATTLESNTFMSTSPDISILPVPGTTVAVKDIQQTRIDCLSYENLHLKAFIRERYGVKAESEANAVLAMKQYQ